MNLKQTIEKRSSELCAKITLLESGLAKEMLKPLRKRDRRLMDFLYKELAVYKFALSELEIILEHIPGNVYEEDARA